MHVLGYKKKETADNESLEQYVIIIKVSINLKKKRNYGTVEKTLYKVMRFSNQLYTINTCM